MTLVAMIFISILINHRRLSKFQSEKITALERSEQLLQEREDFLKNLNNHIVSAQENERKRISQELHDGIGQLLTAIGIDLVLINENYHKSKTGFKRALKDCEDLVQMAIEDVHRFSHDLRPSILDDFGLFPAIQSHARSFSERTGIKIRINKFTKKMNLNDEMKTVFYRVFQEGLNNIAKHAEARTIDIELKIKNGVLTLSITDDGKGFNIYNLEEIKHEERGLGIQGMRERIELIGGHLTIKSKPDAGTTLKVQSPYGIA